MKKNACAYQRKTEDGVTSISFRIPMNPHNSLLVRNLILNTNGLNYREDKRNKVRSSICRGIVDIYIKNKKLYIESVYRFGKLCKEGIISPNRKEKLYVTYEYSTFKESSFSFNISFLRDSYSKSILDMIDKNNVLIMEDIVYDEERDLYITILDINSCKNILETEWILDRAKRREFILTQNGYLKKGMNLFQFNLRECNELFALYSNFIGERITKKLGLFESMVNNVILLEAKYSKGVTKMSFSKSDHKACIKGDIYLLKLNLYLTSKRTLDKSKFKVTLDFNNNTIELK